MFSTWKVVYLALPLLNLRRLAYQLAQRNKLTHKFNRDSEIAPLVWLKGFLKRHQTKLRSPEPTSAARAMGFNQVAVGKFFDLLTSLIEKYNFRPTRIYNVDETGLTHRPYGGRSLCATFFNIPTY
ncbi:hypothetical protein QE152_g25913 [Popillia japonica]|uniref:Transposase n=1 Tax=Popillia japonica TaxID=7064 RepID=A0AAW1K195_POPJA